MKINIIVNIAILLIVGMLITDFIITNLSKNDILKSEFAKTDLIAFNIKHIFLNIKDPAENIKTIEDYLSNIINSSEQYSIYFFTGADHVLFNHKQKKHPVKNSINKETIEQFIFKAINTNKQTINFFGETWGVFWKESKYAAVSYPITPNIGICFIIDLDYIYKPYRSKQKVFLLYILLTAALLSFIGLIRFSKIIIQPIKKLTNLAEKHNNDSDSLYLLQHPPENEFGLLSTSLNSMLTRISEDKHKLQNNINELKKAQNDIIRAEKMSSIGKLSAGVAHEIGNPLGIVLGYIELLKQNNISSEEKHDFLDRAETEIQRIDRIIKELLNLSRKSKTVFQPNSIHEIISEICDMLKIQPAFSSIKLELDLKAVNDIVVSDIDQTKQIFINIILNAVDSILLKQNVNGLIKIKTTENKNTKQFIEIRVSDNGIGISKEKLIKIFDPFYTTKGPGEGTGLGLWVSYRIVDEINGSIKAESIEKQGSTFIIMLPLYIKPSQKPG